MKAHDVAMKRAEEYASRAREAGKPLAEVFKGDANLKVTDTNLFSWLTTGNVPMDPGSLPHISEVDGVEIPGNAFMEKVFSLSPGQVGVAMNHPESEVYVVRLAEFEKPIADLQTDFALENQQRYLMVAGPGQRQIFDAWLADIAKDAGVEWMRVRGALVRHFQPSDMPPVEDEM